MAINDFEVYTNILTTLEHIPSYKVKNSSKFGDFILFNSTEKYLIEIKAAGTSGKTPKIDVPNTRVIEGLKQLNSNTGSFHKKILLLSGHKESLEKTIPKDLSKIPNIMIPHSSFEFSSNKKYNSAFSNIYIRQYDSSSPDYPSLIKEISDQISIELKKQGIRNYKNIKLMLANFYKNDWENFLILDPVILRILDTKYKKNDYKSVKDFASDELGVNISKQEFKTAVANFEYDNLSYIPYDYSNSTDLYNQVLRDEDMGTAVLISYMAKENNGITN